MILERAIELNKDLCVCFFRYEKAFYRVENEDLIKMLEQLYIVGKDLKLIKSLYLNRGNSKKK